VQLTDVVNNGDGTRTVRFTVRNEANVTIATPSVTVPTTWDADQVRQSIRHRAWQLKHPVPAAPAPRVGQTFTVD
jgi:hypothetical protein